MAFRDIALYSDLLVDLQRYLPHSVYDEESAAEQEMDPLDGYLEYASLSLAKSFFKKLEDRTTPQADRVALDKFLLCNEACSNYRPLGSSDKGGFRKDLSLIDEVLIGEIRKNLDHFYYRGGELLTIESIMDNGITGPGASIGAWGGDFYTKLFSSPLTATLTSIYQAYANYISEHPNWYEAEQNRLSIFGAPDIVVGNRLGFVPKNRDTSRVICTEPSLNMFVQLGIGNLIAKRLKKVFGIDLSDQPELNRILARKGSADDRYATVDLSSASDTISNGMLREFLPPVFYEWLQLARSPVTVLPSGKQEKLHMVSSMGNGFTFPLQTAIFCCVVSAVRRIRDHEKFAGFDSARAARLVLSKAKIEKRPTCWGVFGDDIIVPKGDYPLLVRGLSLLGFTVNAEKSFNEGWFRESCGGDYFRGLPVRGVYIKSLKTQASRYVAINRLNRWSAVVGIPLPRTIRRLMKSVRYLPVPLDESDDAGVKVPWSLARESYGKGLSRRDFDLIEYRRWATIPKVLRLSDCGIRAPKGVKVRYYNEPALLEAFLRGDIKECTIGLRTGNPTYAPRTALTPRWDYVQTSGSEEPLGQGRLATAILTNLELG